MQRVIAVKLQRVKIALFLLPQGKSLATHHRFKLAQTISEQLLAVHHGVESGIAADQQLRQALRLNNGLARAPEQAT